MDIESKTLAACKCPRHTLKFTLSFSLIQQIKALAARKRGVQRARTWTSPTTDTTSSINPSLRSLRGLDHELARGADPVLSKFSFPRGYKMDWLHISPVSG